MAKGRVGAKELRRDPLMEQYITTSSWIKTRTRPILTGLTVVAVIAAAILIFWQITSRRERAAADALSEAFKVTEAVVANPLPPNATGYAFTTEEEKDRKIFEAFDKVAHDYPSYYGDLARFYAASSQLKFDPPAAEVTLKDLATRDSSVGAQAKFALAQRYEGSGRLDESLTTLQDLLKKPGDLAPLVIRFTIARVYDAQGKTKEAADAYFEIAKDARSVGIGAVAMAKLSALDPARLDQLPAPEASSPLAGFR
ncbi:MAG: tetratricopeptide repeat protein [Acidobacteriota bacterium]